MDSDHVFNSKSLHGSCKGSVKCDLHKEAVASLPDLNRITVSGQVDDQHKLDDDVSRWNSFNGLTNGDVRRRVGATGSVLERTTRDRIPTERGLEYRKSLEDENRKKAMNRVNRKVKKIKSLLCNNYGNVEKVQKELFELDHLFSEVMEFHGRYHVLVEGCTESEDSSKWMNDKDTLVFECKQNANKWLKETDNITNKESNRDNRSVRSQYKDKLNESFENPEEESVKHFPVLSVKGQQKDKQKSVHSYKAECSRVLPNIPKSIHSSRASSVNSQQSSIRSAKSHPSSGSRVRSQRRDRLRSRSQESKRESRWSKRSHVSGSKYNFSVSSKVSSYIEQKAKVAALKAEAKFLKDSRQAEKDAELWRLEKEIAKAEAVADVYAEEEGRVVVDDRNDTVDKKRKGCDTQLDMEVASSTQLEESMMKLLRLQTAPTVEIDEFSGDPLEYNYFMATFKEAVEQKIDDPRGRLTRLIKYTKGEAKELIKNCIQEDPSEGYNHAISLLSNQYGNPHYIARAYINELRNWEPLKAGDATAFRKFYSFLMKCKTCMSSGTYLKELNSPDVLQCLQSKLPYGLQDKWNRLAVKLRRLGKKEADFNDFVNLVENETFVVNDPMYSREAINTRKTLPNTNHIPKQHKGGMSNFSVEVTQNSEDASNYSVEVMQETTCSCALCGQGHDLDACPEYLKLDVKARKAFVFKKRLCFSCYKEVSATHNSRTCTNKRVCAVCKGAHPSGLHKKEQLKNFATGFDSTGEICKAGYASCQVISMCIVPVKLRHNSDPDNEIIVYAMLDSCSQGTFIAENIVEKLMAPARRTSVTIKTLTGENTEEAMIIEGLQVSAVSDFDGQPSQDITLPRTYSQKRLPVERNDIPFYEKIKHWKHLEPAFKEIPRYNKDIPIGLLIGANCPKALEPQRVIPSSEGGPYAFRTLVGWCISGPILECEHSPGKMSCHRIAVKDVVTDKLKEHHFVVQEELKDNQISDILIEMYQTEFVERSKEKKALSAEDKRFLDIMDSQVKKVQEHYQLPLPLRDEHMTLPNNKEMAFQRAQPLKRKFKKSAKYHEDYTKFMNSLLENGHAQEVDPKKAVKDGRVWYIPHHAVFNKKKPDKVRVVFDCGAKFHGRSLNDELLQGPDLTNLLLGVLMRFRLEDVPIMADIESMFCQVYVCEEHRCLLRFLWWPGGDFTKDLKEYEMCVHVFGAISSGSCANYALQRTASDNELKYGTTAAETLRRNFYVDDALKSVETTEAAIDLIKDVTAMCEAGGFNLTKFVSTEKEVLESLHASKLGCQLQKCDLSKGSMLVERALGVHWCIESDKLQFKMVFQDVPLSRRGMLSTISSVYDPLGTASPFILKGRKILQEVVSEKVSWDEEVSELHHIQWQKWRSKLHLLEDIHIRRCLKPHGFGTVVSTTIHSFADASEIGYGEASYVRQVNDKREISVSLLMGKSRVSPIDATSIPRLELAAAVLAAKMSIVINEELDIPSTCNVFWSDSKIVLGYISNKSKRFKVYVANRTQMIRDLTKSNQWHYVPSDDNPADDASRGMEVDSDNVERWFNGPSFLRRADENWTTVEDYEVSDEDPELKKVVKVNAVSLKENLLSTLGDRFSSWYRCVRVIATIQKFIQICHRKVAQRHSKDGAYIAKKEDIKELRVVDLEEAERRIIKMVQLEHFHTELELLKRVGTCESGRDGEKRRKATLRKSSALQQLDPFLDHFGIIRVGGRLRRSNLDDLSKHPIVLPKNSKVTTMIVRWFHQKVQHSGRNMTLNEIRDSGFWVINGNSFVRHTISKCVRCRYLRGQTGEQKMADLPRERVNESPPFTYCGVDMFGPFIIKEGRKQLKRYGILFTCLSCRAIHIETTNTMETDSFIQALRRFIARRGVVRSIRSDNGGNFVGAEAELKKALSEMSHEKIRGFLQSQGADWIEWERNPPTASHMGGVWERQIRSVRNVLSSLMKTHGHALDDESLRTLLTEAESIVNCRPLTVDGISDPESVGPLTPNHILTSKSKVSLGPPGVFQKADIYCRKRWRRVQHIANEFWSRWRREFLASLQKRSKWCNIKRNFSKGDIVIIKENSRRNQWPMGRVIEVYPDTDGVVRKVRLKTSVKSEDAVGQVMDRPIAKLVLLLESEMEYP